MLILERWTEGKKQDLRVKSMEFKHKILDFMMKNKKDNLVKCISLLESLRDNNGQKQNKKIKGRPERLKSFRRPF